MPWTLVAFNRIYGVDLEGPAGLAAVYVREKWMRFRREYHHAAFLEMPHGAPPDVVSAHFVDAQRRLTRAYAPDSRGRHANARALITWRAFPCGRGQAGQ